MFTNKHSYTLSSPKSIDEIQQILLSNALQRKSLLREHTDKPFIGLVNDHHFSVIASSKTGAFCVLNGNLKTTDNDTVIEIETKLHKAFQVLYIVWAIFVVAGSIVGFFVNADKQSSISQFITLMLTMATMILLARYLLHRAYIFSRNRGIKRIESLLS